MWGKGDGGGVGVEKKWMWGKREGVDRMCGDG